LLQQVLPGDFSFPTKKSLLAVLRSISTVSRKTARA
jgi:hypothetical protein